MNGNRYILDTNAIIALLKGHTEVLNSIKRAVWIGISVISYMEFLAFPDISNDDKELFSSFIQRVNVIDIKNSDKQLMDLVISYKIKYGIKLPDSIIIATAAVNNAKLITSDKQILAISDIEIVPFSP
jgi:hypothetical protein